MTEYRMTIEAKNRQDLTTQIDISICAGGARIGQGTYEVIIRRVPKHELEEERKVQEQRAREQIHSRPVEGHSQDQDCTDIDPETDCCRVCGTYHGDSCPKCHRRAFHTLACPLRE